MVSRRNYLAITAVMLVVLFLFQFTNVALESWNAYESNEYAVDRQWLPKKSQIYDGQIKAGQKPEGMENEDGSIVVYIGSPEGPEGKVVNTWASYAKRKIRSYETLEEYERLRQREGTEKPHMLMADSRSLDWEKEETVRKLEDIVRSGTDLVLCSLPDVSVIKDSSRLRRLLGIVSVEEEETTVDGLHLYGGFLLGGETVYQAGDEEEYRKRQDMELVFPWYVLGSGTKAYMRGIFEDRELEEEDCPAVIWRNRLGRSYVFAVNGSYMEDAAGLGLLAAMWAQSEEYVLYPVVNAQNMVFANYPGLAAENSGEMMRRYGRTLPEMLQNNAWPAVVAAYQRSTMGLSCMLAPQYDYEDDNYPDQSRFLYYMKRIHEQGGEVGLSGAGVSLTSLDQKLGEDARLMAETIPGYRFASFYGNGLTDEEIDDALETEFLEAVRTVVTGYDSDSEVVGYQSEEVTRQRIISQGDRHTFLEDFRVRGVETALAYTSVLADLSRGAYPQGDDDTFEKIISDLGWNTQHYWENFREFTGTTVSQCDERIRRFLTLDYTDVMEQDSIRLEITGSGMPAWSILRTDKGAVSQVTGGSWKELESGVYLIEAEETSVTIRME